jgi:hypothetical protein
MSYLGSPPASQFFAPGTDTFSGDGTTVAFTLSRNVGTVNDILVVVNNVDQQPSNYTVASNILTFSPAPSAGTNNIYVRYLSTNLQTIAPQQGSVTRQALDVGSSVGTGAMQLPSGTTAERPAIPLAGMSRFNTTTGGPEWYSSATSSWIGFNQTATYSVDYLVIAGGGAGDGGGGGAGGVVSSSTSLSTGTATTVTVGAGGLNPSNFGNVNNSATNGNNSSFGAIAIATGGGAARYNQASISGGSGGGGGIGSFAGGSGTSGQGFAGGTAGATSGGGGGGAGAVGSNGSAGTAGAGGVGSNAYSTWASATSTGVSGFYAGGGGGGGAGGGSAGGSGGGGAGGNLGNSVAGTANTGGGGGGIYSSYPAANGGSGIVIVRYIGAQRGTGGTVTSSGGFTYHTFTTSGTFTA